MGLGRGKEREGRTFFAISCSGCGLALASRFGNGRGAHALHYTERGVLFMRCLHTSYVYFILFYFILFYFILFYFNFTFLCFILSK